MRDFRDLLVRTNRFMRELKGSTALLSDDILLRKGMDGFYPLETLTPGVRLSIQGSNFTYCTPREGNIPAAKYTHMEVAIIAADGAFVGIEHFPELQYINPVGYGRLLMNFSNTLGHDVYPYVEVEHIQELCDALGVTGRYLDYEGNSFGEVLD